MKDPHSGHCCCKEGCDCDSVDIFERMYDDLPSTSTEDEKPSQPKRPTEKTGDGGPPHKK
jgi:hypothetical protein